MRSLGIRDLKAQFSRIVREVESGEIVVVTDRGRPIAEIRPPAQGGAEALEVDPALLKMARDGKLILPRVRNHPGLYERSHRPTAKPGLAAELLDWTRGDR
ncbi:MAG TPA: type II toxin-antitoxin system prevent-host-death family antitoxin [Thermoanaerobaculia bacterium]|nr:type II toxin-antitoxin system prevent-host-death family antitoxin [Thermoanaerobaculia bacterium]